MPRKLDSIEVRLADNIFLRIKYAKEIQGESNRTAEFSADLFSESPKGEVVRLCTFNKLVLLDTQDRTTRQRVVHIGSISHSYQNRFGERKVYSITFFPGSQNSAEIEKQRSEFAASCVKAVEAFMSKETERLKRDEEERLLPNPALAGIRTAAQNLRSYAQTRSQEKK